MEYVYAALLIHKAGGKVDEASLKRVVESAGVKANDAKIKALVAALEGKNIDEAIKKASAVPVALASASASAPVHAGEKKEEKPKVNEKKAEEDAAAGLSALFG